MEPLSLSRPYAGPVRASVVILAAGASRRMGRPKDALAFPTGGTFLERVVGVYAGEDCLIVAVLGSRDQWTAGCRTAAGGAGVTIVVNDAPGADRMSSILLGLRALAPDRYAFIQDVDRPFITAATVRALHRAARDGAYVAPMVVGGTGHPVLLSPEVVQALCTGPSAGTLRESLAPFARVAVDLSGAAVDVNINSESDYQRILANPALFSLADVSLRAAGRAVHGGADHH